MNIVYIGRYLSARSRMGGNTNVFLAKYVLEPYSMFFWEANQRKEVPTRRFCKVKEKAGVSESIALLSRTSYAKKRMGISIMDSEDVKKHENTSNLPELHFRGYDYCLDRCKFGDTIFVSSYGVRIVPMNLLNGRVDGGIRIAREYLTSVGAISGKFFSKLFNIKVFSCLRNLFRRLFYGETLQKRGMCPARNGMELETRDEEELTDIKEGDVINIPNLLFHENRDYLVRYNGQKVKAEELVGKAILLYFVPVCIDLGFAMETERTTSLIDIYNDLLPNNDFEVIVVADDERQSVLDIQRDPRKNFKSMFARMPWTAVPFSDKPSRKSIARKFGVWGKRCTTYSVFLNTKGVVLKCGACDLFGEYGTQGYPFTDERIKSLDSKDDEVAKQPSLESLLGSPERDYLISNKGDRVPIHTLKDKVVALFFCEDSLSNFDLPELTRKLKTVYKELAQSKEHFEVVLLYLYDTYGTISCTDEESFWDVFETMPWLALPYKDSNHKKLKRIFGYPDYCSGPERVPTLVIIGPNIEYVDSCGANIVMKYGTPAYPFTRKRLAMLETEMIKDLKLEMLWDPNTLFNVNKDGLEIPFSKFAGKRLLIYFEMNKYCQYKEREIELRMMRDLYFEMKGTYDEFEVLYIKKLSSDNRSDAPGYLDEYGELPWPVHYYDEGYSLSKELECTLFHFNYYSDDGPKGYHSCLLAFDREGSIVRKSIDITFDDTEFPFCAGGLEKQFLDQLSCHLEWYSRDHYEQEHHIIYRGR